MPRMAKRKNPNAVALGKKGGEARAKCMSAKERSESARKAVEARWERVKQDAVEAMRERAKQKPLD